MSLARCEAQQQTILQFAWLSVTTFSIRNISLSNWRLVLFGCNGDTQICDTHPQHDCPLPAYETWYFRREFFSTVSLYCSARVIGNWLHAPCLRCRHSSLSSLIEHERAGGQWSDMGLVWAIRQPLSLFDDWKNAIKIFSGNIGQRTAVIIHPFVLFPSARTFKAAFRRLWKLSFLKYSWLERVLDASASSWFESLRCAPKIIVTCYE